MRNVQENAGCLRRKSRITIKRMRGLAKSKRMHAGKAAKRLASPPPERREPIVQRMAICLFVWVEGKPHMRMMQLDPTGRASFRITTGGKLMATREGPVTSLSRATEILRRRAVTFRGYA